MAEGIRIRHVVCKGTVMIVEIPDYGPNKVTKNLWLRLDLDGTVIITDPTWQLLQEHTPGEWELLDTVLHPPTQRVTSNPDERSPAQRSDDLLRLRQQAQLLNEWRGQQAQIKRAAIELAPPGTASAHITQDGIDPTSQRPRLTLSR